MDANSSRLLADKLYDRRKAGALELENTIRNCLHDNNHDRIAKIVHQLCQEYAYAVHQPHARNGGLIGLAAAAIALGADVARYLKEIVPPVLACFSDQDARVRYYACESLYNIAKVAKGEILVYFNDVFDALCKLSADNELSVKNGAELLDRLVKDIVSESAATYASIVAPEGGLLEEQAEQTNGDHTQNGVEGEKAFNLPRFIPLLQERILVLNPFTRNFLVSWITLLDSIPDLELVAYLPSFLGGLLKFLSDPNQDVHTTTKVALDRFRVEIKHISNVKRNIAESKKSREHGRKPSDGSSAVVVGSPQSEALEMNGAKTRDEEQLQLTSLDDPQKIQDAAETEAVGEGPSLPEFGDEEEDDDDDDNEDEDGFDDEWTPGQDTPIDYQRILNILLTFLDNSTEEEIQVTTLKWIETFMDICPEDILAVTPKLLAQVLPALSHDVDHVEQAAKRVNTALMTYIMSLPEHQTKEGPSQEQATQQAQPPAGQPSASQPPPPAIPVLRNLKDSNGSERQSTVSLPARPQQAKKPLTPEPISPSIRTTDTRTPEPHNDEADVDTDKAHVDFDYEAAVNSLTLQFLHEHEATRVAALAWLIMLHRKSPRRILAIQDATFPALLKTLSDPAEAVVQRDLLLLSQISKSSDDSYFTSFMINLLKLFATDRRLLETRGNLIIRQLCTSLSAEKIYRIMSDCLEQEPDIEFASIMVQNLNNNLITAPELADLRKRLRNLDSRDGQTFFTVLFKAWCVNAVATFSLCLLAQAYEQAYHLLQIFAEIEMTITMLIQLDKLVQLLESPVFTYLRMQLLEPERYPHLYKCLYGILMLMPQSSAFAALKNRLNSVSPIGYLHLAPQLRGAGGAAGTPGGTTPSSVSSFERQNRIKSREEGAIKWGELLDKFKATQDRVRRANQRHLAGGGDEREDVEVEARGPQARLPEAGGVGRVGRPDSALSWHERGGGGPVAVAGPSSGGVQGKEEGKGHGRHRSGLSQLGRLAGAGRSKGKKAAS